jgi:hypothetical protein
MKPIPRRSTHSHVETPRSWCNADFSPTTSSKELLPENSNQESPGINDKNLRKVYSSFTGFTRSSTCSARATIAQQEVWEVPQMNNLMNNLKMGLGLVGLGLIALLVCVSLLLMGAAQDTTDTSPKTRTVTGCLQTGDHPNEYHLIAESAKWDLKSDKVRLADHVGHKVKVDGAVSNAALHKMKEDIKGELDKTPTETGDLTVTNLEMVSGSCK